MLKTTYDFSGIAIVASTATHLFFRDCHVFAAHCTSVGSSSLSGKVHKGSSGAD
jgi:hypothetical protein